ncbi:RadC family protein [Brevibacillus panacihumi]|uniref:RadC family protein n=1 Tax=Brevibacillus panacihumi TaxID=497735 RepID=UPI003D05C4F8
MFNKSMKQLIAHTLCEKPESYVINELFKRYTSLQELLAVTEEELTLIPGIGPVKAKAIVSALQLARVLAMPQGQPYIIRRPLDVYDYVKSEMMFLSNEQFCCLFLNTKNHVIAKDTISIGSLDSAIIHPREVYRAAIKRNSASIICIHNHPSGDPTPSREDIEVTKRLSEAGEILGIPLLDHVIIGHNKYQSLKESGLI